MTKLSPFYTDDKTAQAILAAVKDHKAQAQNGQITGAGASDVTTQFQNTCQFKLTADWKELSASNFVASGKKIVPLTAGAEKRPYPTTIYAYGEKPTSNKDSIIVATRRANRWVLLPTGSGGETSPKNQKVRLVQPKELFPACEYKTLQDVYGGALEYSDDGEAWIPAYDMNIVSGRDVFTLPAPDASLNPHKHWRINLKGFAKPEDPQDPYADRGFYTFGRLWEALFWVKRDTETKKTAGGTEYTFSAAVPHWQINTAEPLSVSLALSPSVSGGELFYKSSTGDWRSLGSFSSATTLWIPAEDIQITVEDGKERNNTSFQFRVEANVDGNKEEVGNLTLRKPTYTLSPERPASFTLPESPVVEEANGYKMTAKVTSHWQSISTQVSVNISLDPPVLEGRLHYRCETGAWQELNAIHQDKTVSIPDDDLKNSQNTFFEFAVSQYDLDIVGVRIPKPTYPISPDSAEIAMPPSREDIEVEHLFFDSKPTPRKAQNHRMWMLTFDQPETVTQVMLDVDQHCEHYVVCPGGRDVFKQDISLIYSFDLTSERWTATTFPEMQKPMYNMDAKVVELADNTHQLVVLSGQIASGFSNIIQGYNFEKDYIQNVVDLGEGSLNFAGRPALSGDPMYRYGYLVNTPDGEWDFAKSLIVVGGSERSCFIRGTMSAIDSVLFSVQGSTLTIGCPYETSTLNITLSNVGNTGLPFGFFDYKTSVNTSAGAVGTRLQNMGTYTRHQNLPVRGILRRRPQGNTSQPSSSNPCIDFLLIGGFNPVGREEYNTKIVSGIFHSPTPSAANGAQYSLLIQNPHFYNVNNESSLLYFPDSAFALGDCCAEYVEERDEIICFGGRASETDTAVAHANLAVLEFTPGNNARWNYRKYPPMPHPRWSAASVLIKGLVRLGETIPCDRIFIIGGRNREGFVPEVDVFNLRYNDWETDWKGLDQGELEDFTPSGGSGGTTIIIQGGGDGIQSINAGEGISITGNSKTPTISANIAEIVDKIISNETFKTEIAQKISENSSFRNAVATSIINNSEFQQFVAELLLSNTEFKNAIIEAVTNSPTLMNNIVGILSGSQFFLNNVAGAILNNQAFVNLVIDAVVNNASLVSEIVNRISGDETFISTVLGRLVSNQSFVNTIVNLMLENADFQTTIAQQIINSSAFVNLVKNGILGDPGFKQDILINILSNAEFRQEIIQALTQNNALIQNISETILANSTFISNIANEILQNQTVLQQIIHDVVNNDYLVSNIVQNIVNNETLLTNITTEIISNETLIGDIINQVVHNQNLYNQIIEEVLISQTFVESITNQIVQNETIINNITQEITTNQTLFQQISEYISTSNVFIGGVTEQIINNSNVINNITNEVLHNETLIQNIANTILTNETVINVLSGAVSLVAPDGSSIATNDGGKLTVQTATNDRYGIVKGQANNTSATWHHVSAAANGTLSINRERLEALINQKVAEVGCTCAETGMGTTLTEEIIVGILNRITLVAPDGSVIAVNHGGRLMVQQANPDRFGIVKCCHSCCCYKMTSILAMQSIDAMLIADVQNGKDLYFPMVFPQKLPTERSTFLNKLTFIADDWWLEGLALESIDKMLVAERRGLGLHFPMVFPDKVPKNRADFLDKLTFLDKDVNDFIKDFEVSVFNPDKDFVKDFGINIYDPAKDFIKDFDINVSHSEKDFVKDFDINVYDPTKDFIKDMTYRRQCLHWGEAVEGWQNALGEWGNPICWYVLEIDLTK